MKKIILLYKIIMGIPHFFNKLRKKCSEFIIENNHLLNQKWDYLFFDFQSLIYSTYHLLSVEINYYIKLLYYISYLINNNKIKFITEISSNYHTNYKQILLFFIKKNKNFFLKIYKSNYNEYINNIKDNEFNIISKLLSLEYNNINIIIDILSENVVEFVKKIADTHIYNTNTYDKTYIFFDGIPSRGKIKEQLTRKIYPEVFQYLKEDLKNIASSLELDINSKLLNDNPPSIGIGTPIIKKLKFDLDNISHPIKGKFNVNSLDAYGEAEHQIMLYLENNIQQFKNNSILLISPDADLIILSIITFVKNIKFDILKISVELKYDIDIKYYSFLYNTSNKITPFYYIYNYIYINKVISCLHLNTTQECLDIAYILLLLGDDFLPIVPNLNINYIDEIIKNYKQLNDILLINKNKIYLLNYSAFIKLINKLSKLPNRNNMFDPTRIINIEKQNLLIMNKFVMFSQYNMNKFNFFNKLYYLSKGIYINKHNQLECLITNTFSNTRNIDALEPKIINYLEGVQFILDLYLNNIIKNYNWLYNYDTAPYLDQIYSFLLNKTADELNNIFDYTKHSKLNKYLSYSSYQEYINLLKFHIIKHILERIIKDNKLIINSNNIDQYMKQYINYNNVKNIFICNGQKYINKCLEIIMIDIPDKLLVSF